MGGRGPFLSEHSVDGWNVNERLRVDDVTRPRMAWRQCGWLRGGGHTHCQALGVLPQRQELRFGRVRDGYEQKNEEWMSAWFAQVVK